MNTPANQPLSSVHAIISAFLQREVLVTIILPLYFDNAKAYPVLFVNDGQDFEALGMIGTLHKLQVTDQITSVITVGIHAGADRLQEYGTVCMPDYANRGSRARATTDFVLHELLPFISNLYNVEKRQIVYAGFSLGGLMALDMVWNHADIFSKVGIFSGALWWRKRALDAGYRDIDRIMHQQIRDTQDLPAVQFWFQTGTNDETDDRDNDGIIDSIQDTLECIAELERKSYVWGKDIRYLEMRDGEHTPQTWGLAMPDFLIWAFGKETK